MSNVPNDLQYLESHEWLKIQGDVATIGITDFAQDQLTDVVYVELPKKGAKVDAAKPFGVVESVKSVSDLFAGVSGEVVDVNESLKNKPEQINDDPYGQGWLVKIRLGAAPSGLLDATAYRKVIGE